MSLFGVRQFNTRSEALSSSAIGGPHFSLYPHQVSLDPAEARTHYLLPKIAPEKIELGRKMASLLLADDTCSEKKFLSLGTLSSKLARTVGISQFSDQEIPALAVALYQLFIEEKVVGFGNKLVPASNSRKIIVPGGTIEVAALRCYLARFVLQEVYPYTFTTARDLEIGFSQVAAFVKDRRIDKLLNAYSAMKLVDLAYPGLTTSDSRHDPVVRPWMLYQQKKWSSPSGKLLAADGMAWLLRHGVRVCKDDGGLDGTKIAAVVWERALRDFDIPASLLSVPSIGNDIGKAIALGARKLGIQLPIGIDEGQVLPWKVSRHTGWSKPDALNALPIDDLTRFVMRNFAAKYPHYFFADGPNRGLIDPAVVPYISWSSEYRCVATKCLQQSALKPADALARVYPHIFGWEKGQILPEAVNVKWNLIPDDQVEAIAAKRVCHALCQEGLGSFEAKSERYELTTRQFALWRQHHEQDSFSFSQFVSRYRLNFAWELAGKSVARMVASALGGIAPEQKYFANDHIYQAFESALGAGQPCSISFPDSIRRHRPAYVAVPDVLRIVRANEQLSLSELKARVRQDIKYGFFVKATLTEEEHPAVIMLKDVTGPIFIPQQALSVLSSNGLLV